MTFAARYTVTGGDAVESSIDGTVTRIAEGLRRLLPADEVESAVLVGGYGRGEGAVEIDEQGNEHPHNDLDIVVITRHELDPKRFEEGIDRELRPTAASVGLDLEVSFISSKRLARDDCRILWYEMRNGHRTLLGPTDFLSRFDQFRVERLLIDDVRDLVLNRTSLLAVLALIEREGNSPAVVPALGIRYLWKCVLACGDALLAYQGRYHFSTVERGRRLASSPVPESLRKLYARALEWRARVPRSVTATEYSELKAAALPVLREAVLLGEAERLRRPGLLWRDLPAASLVHALTSRPSTTRSALRRLKNLVVTKQTPSEWPPLWRIGARAAGGPGRLSIVAPAVCLGVPELEPFARQLLRAGSGPLDRAFLTAWSKSSEPQLPSFLAKYGIRLG